jgi:hypothetical protein
VLALLLATEVAGQSLSVPRGTLVYGELAQSVTSRKEETSVGDRVEAHAWRNVLVQGQVVVEAGAPMVVRVASFKPARFAGFKGKLELEAVSVRAVDGSEIALDGGYDKSGRGRKALSISLAALAWPLVFIKGKQAVLEPGIVFDATLQEDVQVSGLEATPSPPEVRSSLEVEVLYDEMDPEGNERWLPMRIRLCGGALQGASVVTVNEQLIEAIPVTLRPLPTQGDCRSARGELDLKRLPPHFRRGINRFEIECGDARAPVILEIEL